MLPDCFFLSFCVFLVVWLNAWMELREPSRMANFHITYILSSNIDLIYTSAKNCRRISKSHTIGGLLASRRHRGYRTWTSFKIWGAQSQPLPCISLCPHSWFLVTCTHFFPPVRLRREASLLFHFSPEGQSPSAFHDPDGYHKGDSFHVPVLSAIPLVSLTPSVAPGVWPSAPYAAPHNGPWCLTSLLLLWGVATGQSEPSPNHCRIWRNKTVVLCTSVQD